MGRSPRLPICLLAATGIIAALLLAVMVWLDQPLRTAAAPHGIVSFEIAGTSDAITRILESWGPEGRRRAAVSLRLDYVFLMAYATALSLLCGIVAQGWAASRPRLRQAGMLLAACQWLAAMLDAAENLLLQCILAGALGAHLPLAARWCALVKFTLIACGWLYILVAGGIRVIRHFAPQAGRCDH